jgi:hypothetical protein
MLLIKYYISATIDDFFWFVPDDDASLTLIYFRIPLLLLLIERCKCHYLYKCSKSYKIFSIYPLHSKNFYKKKDDDMHHEIHSFFLNRKQKQQLFIIFSIFKFLRKNIYFLSSTCLFINNIPTNKK